MTSPEGQPPEESLPNGGDELYFDKAIKVMTSYLYVRDNESENINLPHKKPFVRPCTKGRLAGK